MSLKKYLTPRNYYRYVVKAALPPNLIVNRLAKPVAFDDLQGLRGVESAHFDIRGEDHDRWVERYYPDWRETFGHLRHKKLVEFSISFALLAPQPDDVFMDAAGGGYTYVRTLACKKKYLQDLRISPQLKSDLGDEVECIESDAGDIALPDRSLGKISCHHAFEHFRSDSDRRFISEVQRLLAPGGRCCIVPIFIATRYVEVTNALAFDRKYDRRSKRIMDPTATIAGGSQVAYARIYDLEAFQERVLRQIDLEAFKVRLLQVRMDGQTVPDLTLDVQRRVTAVNNPFRALLIERTP